jgi:IS30 family transposase
MGFTTTSILGVFAMKHYRQLSLKERYQIDALKEMGWHCSAMARRLNRHRSTISRELRRNNPENLPYSARPAQRLSDSRRRSAHKAVFSDKKIIRRIRTLLKLQWSPEQIAGTLAHAHGSRPVSHEWIYRFIRRDKAHGGNLYCHPRHGKRLFRKRYGSRKIQSTIPNRIDIQQRPVCVEQRSRLGDWEGDTIIGADLKSVLVTLVERKSGLLRCAKLKNRHSREVAQTVVQLLKPIRRQVHTITFDNGTEFGRHQHISNELGANIYFAKPYCSWQRGTNENTNGLLRQYFPKKTIFNSISNEEINEAMNRINNRPRKRHGFISPNEIFQKLKKQDSNRCTY